MQDQKYGCIYVPEYYYQYYHHRLVLALKQLRQYDGEVEQELVYLQVRGISKRGEGG